MPYLRLISVDFVLSKNIGRSKTEHKPLTTRKQILRLFFFFFFFFFLFILRRMVDSGHDNDIRCHHCAGPLTKTLETSEWTVSPFIRDSFSMIGSAVGGTASAFIGFNHVMPIVRKWIKGPMWLHFLVGAPPVIVLSSACAGLAGGTVPALAQLASSSYQAAVLSSQPPQAEENHKMHKSTASSL